MPLWKMWLAMMMTRRLSQLIFGLTLYGVSTAMMMRAALGLSPWSVFHEGLAPHLGLPVGMIVNLVGAALLLLWIPLRQKPGIGTIANVLVIGTAVDLTMLVLPTFDDLTIRATLLVGGVLLNGVSGAIYIGAGLGPGPRDGLMTGLVARTGWPIRPVRTGIELAILVMGWLLGGTVGLGTVLYALAIGAIVQALLPRFTVRDGAPQEAVAVNS